MEEEVGNSGCNEIFKYPSRKSKLLKKALVNSGKFTSINLSHCDW